uniref:patatin-like phospholipase family protein n=1 Tax=Yoonia sp. TaxID=2212373 RepID=UPI004048012E
MRPDPGKRALVLCGGSRGAVEVGFHRALNELGIRFDMILGTSIGAFNGAMIASGMKADDIETLWKDFELRKAVSWNWGGLLRPRQRPGLMVLDRFRLLLGDVLPRKRFEDLLVPLSVTTTSLEQGRAVYWEDHGDLIEPVIASMSLPGIFPPVILNGEQHVDGGIANNVPLDRAQALGATEAYVIECYCNEPCLRPPRGPIQVLTRSFSIAIDSKYHSDMAYLRREMKIIRIRPEFDNNLELMNFSRTRDLIETGYETTMRKLTGMRTQTVSNSASMIGQAGTSP